MTPRLTSLLFLAMATLSSAADYSMFIGTYTPKDGASRGIYAVKLNGTTGEFSAPTVAAETSNPTFLALHPSGRFVYALGEQGTVNGKPGGAAVSFASEPGSDKLTLLNTQPTGGIGGAHIALSPNAHTLAFASYHGGYVASFPVGADGKIGALASTNQHTGQLGPNKGRQDKPHPHSTTFSPDGRFACVCDLGLDRVFIYQIDAATGKFTPSGHFVSAPGAGPRHSKFSSDGKFFYALNEIDGTIGVYNVAPVANGQAPKQIISTLPAGFVVTDPDRAAEIRIHPNGKFVYASNRGHESIAVFSRNAADGTLTLIEITPCGGKHPRNFALSPDGAWLVCANMDSDNLVSFKVDPSTGRLTASGHTATVPRAVCVLFR